MIKVYNSVYIFRYGKHLFLFWNLFTPQGDYVVLAAERFMNGMTRNTVYIDFWGELVPFFKFT